MYFYNMKDAGYEEAQLEYKTSMHTNVDMIPHVWCGVFEKKEKWEWL